jgi:E3 ubiquitin ligase
MKPVFVVIAAVAAIVGVGLLWWRSRVGRELGFMAATKTSNARDVASMAVGSVVVLKGKLATDAPLKGEFSGRECVYYRALVEREVERVERDSDGTSRTERSYETVSSTEEHAPCRLEDASGAVAVDFARAKVEAIQSHQRYEPAGAISVIGVVLNVSGTVLGQRYTEWIIPPDIPVYILATVLSGGSVGASPTRANPFVISHKSEEERERSLGSTRLWTLVGAIGCFVVAIVLLVAGA